MAILRPNMNPAVSIGATYVLEKHMNWKTEFGIRGLTDLLAATEYLDTEGDTWQVGGAASASVFQIESTGLKIQTSAAALSEMFIYYQDAMESFDPMDHVWGIAKVVDGSLASNGATYFVKTLLKGPLAHLTRWERTFSGGNPRIQSKLLNAGTTFTFFQSDAIVDDLFSIESTGLYFCLRRQLASAAFPSIPNPTEIPIVPIGNFQGYLGAAADTTNPASLQVNTAVAQFGWGVEPTAAVATSMTVEECWIYRRR